MSVSAGERRIVSVLVADLAGSTPIAETLGPERSKFLFDEVIRLMRQEVERLGGTVAQLTGDGVFALFGVPTAHEDDAERAVRAALAIHEALGHYDADIGPAYGIELRARVAVNTGPVVVPAGDEPPERLYNALGDTVNVAARLEGAGGSSGVCVGETTARQLGGIFELEPLGELELKGKHAPVSAFVVAGVREVEPSSRVDVPLVGREQELAALDGVLAALREGSGAVVSITGEAGIGKSRLLAAVKERYEDVRFLDAHAVSYADNSPYWSLRELLRGWLGLGVSDPEARLRLELRAGLARALGEEADEAYPLLATLLGLPLEQELEERLRDLSRDSIQRQTVDWLLRLTTALGRERPVCLVFEDLHWADEATLTAVDELLGVTDDEAVAIVLVHRSDPDHGAWQVVDRARRRYRHRFQELELGPLAPPIARRLAENAAGAELPEAVADLLADRSGGNPFFLEEALRDLVERGTLRRENGRFELAAGIDALSVPALVQEALQARLDRLAAETRGVLNVAAVIGRSFGLPLLERLLPREELRAALPELQRLDLVVEERRQPAREYRFRHGLVQEVAYASLVEARRRDLHLRVGEALEELHRESPEEVYGLLAHHFSQGDEAERAVEYLLEAGDSARALFADQEAITHYRRALAFLDRTGDHARARETLFKVALAHHLAFDFEAAARAYEDAFSHPEPEPRRLDPTERIEFPARRLYDFTPGHSYSLREAEATDMLFRGLLRLDRDLNVVPELAERFSVAADGRSYRFRLRSDARWSDDEPVTADDFRFTWERMREERVAALPVLEDVERVEALDDLTLEIRLREPRSYFPYVLAQPYLYPWPRRRVEALGDAWRSPANLVSNGPFVLERIDDEGAVAVANPRWAGRRGNVREIRIRFRSPEEPVLEQWRAGRYDFLSTEDPAALDEPNAELTPMDTTEYVGLNSHVEPFTDERIRRAFAHAVDRRRPAELDAAAEPALRGGMIPPALPGHSPRVAPEFNPERASALLAEAGFPGGRGLPELVFAFPEMPAAEMRAQMLAAFWRALGARVRVQVLSDAEVLDWSLGGQAHLWALAWLADYPDPDGFLRTFIERNRSVYRDEQIEGLLRRARSLTDQEERLRLYRELEQVWLFERAAVVPILYPRFVELTRPWIEGAWWSPLPKSVLDEIVVRPELRP